MKYLIKSLYLFFLLICCGCNPNCTCNDRDYKDLFLKEFQKDTLLKEIQGFEINNPKHLDSKIFLAEVFYLQGNLDLAWNYLRRAEEIVNQQDFCCISNEICKMYSLISQIKLEKKDFDGALECALKAVKNEFDSDEKNRFLLGRTYFVSSNYDKAVENYEIAYSNFPEEMKVFDAKNYMFALNELNRYEDAKNILLKICETGSWYNGLGKFASQLYKNLEDYEKAFIFTYLDYEFISQLDVNSLEENIFNKITSNEDRLKDFFGFNYLKLKKKISSKNICEQDFIQLLTLEPYFVCFPSFYWQVWQAVELLAFDERINYLPVLKKIIVLNPDGVYADFARKKIQEIISREENLSKELFDRIFF